MGAMEPVIIYDYLALARRRIFEWTRPLSPEQYARRLPGWGRTLDRLLTPTAAGSRSWRASMAQDVAKGRTTEIGEMNGHVVAQGRETGVPTPISAAIVAAVREVETGARPQSPRNLEHVLRHAGAPGPR